MPNIIMAVGGFIIRVIVTPENMLKAGGLHVAMQSGWQPKGQQQQTDERAEAVRHAANENLKQNSVKPWSDSRDPTKRLRVVRLRVGVER
jgi:hypothetical protein